ncbi:Vacuolar protein sorting-associated protein 8-like [Holothuria leucospilota]|uniref:Vacuolar protein sorting-associated protein 8-like n=1 Tax=Holothuria leucospilota TaxID=206669 RepID=A0A9Q1BCE9_HOLLE|nr:Vacuolar protein sorting-associated protein 8-like [Holothuria leucospilota]
MDTDLEVEKAPEVFDGSETLVLSQALDDVVIDDTEFDIPELERTATLESILNEEDNDFEPDLDGTNLFPPGSDSSSDTQSIDGESRDTPDRTPTKGKRQSVQYPVHGSILRHVTLKSVSSQVTAAADRVDAGKPSALAVGMYIAVGTSHGLILVFDPQQTLKWCLGSTAVGAQYGAVSALCINNDSTRLLAGFAKGQMTMWDLMTGKLLRTMTDAHPPGSAVLHIQFTDDPTIAICSDSGGSVFELTFKRVMGIRSCESRCLFSGSRGEVFTLAPLRTNFLIKDHPLKDMMLLAMATLSKVFMVHLRPRLTVIFTKQLKGPATTLPLLAWQIVIIQVTDSSRVIDPVLAFGRHDTIYFYQVVYQEGTKVKFAPLQIMKLSYSLLNMQWMNAHTMVTVDTSENLHLLHIRTEEELEVMDLMDIELVYGNSFFKSLATGGNVSEAMALAGERACYQSVETHKGQLLLLGTKSVHVMTLRPWKDRIQLLVKEGNFKGALQLANSFLNGKARAVLGLQGTPVQKKIVVTEQILSLLHKYVDVSMNQTCPKSGAIHLLEEHFQEVIPVCVDECLVLERLDMLFGAIYDQFSRDTIARGVFLECLEPYILNDKLTSIPPHVMKDFVEHYRDKEMVPNVEACIVHMDIASLDIHQVVSLCWAYGLYDAIIYVYNKGMNDYVTPLEELIQLLRAALSTGNQLSDNQVRLGNKILVYVSCCLAGRAYPLGDIPEHLVQDVKEGIWKCLTALHTKDASEDEPTYPVLRLLLKYNTREFLNVLSLAFAEPEFDNSNGDPNAVQSRQRIVDILLQVMVESVGFSPAQVGFLFTFLARQMAKYENSILVNRLLFDQVLEFLSNPSEESRHEEREQAFLELLNSGGLGDADEDKLLSLAEKAKFNRVCEVLYEKRRQFDKILLCYLRESARRPLVFNFIHQVMMESFFQESEKDAVQKEALKQLEDLLAIDPRETAQLVLRDFATPLAEIVGQMEDKPRLQLEFLQGVFEGKESTTSSPQAQVDSYIHQLYLELLCRFRKEMVLNFIMTSEGYKLEEALQIVRSYKLSDATAFLLEKAGDIHGAFGILQESLLTKIKALMEVVEIGVDNYDQNDANLALANIQAILMVIVQLCQRNTGSMDEKQRETLWFSLLDTIMTSQKRLKLILSEAHFEVFKDMSRHVLNSMMGYISLPSILQKIMQDPAYNVGKFGEMKELLLGMLDTYTYEKTLLKTTNSLLAQDLYSSLNSLVKSSHKALAPQKQTCLLCGKRYISSYTEPVIVFSCGHTYHTSCLQSAGFSAMIDGQRHWTCYQCNSSKRGNLSHQFRSQRILSSSSESQSPLGTSISHASGGGIRDDKSQTTDYLSFEQETALANLEKRLEGPSRLGLLSEISRSQRDNVTQRGVVKSDSILHRESFKLRLAPPPLVD